MRLTDGAIEAQPAFPQISEFVGGGHDDFFPAEILVEDVDNLATVFHAGDDGGVVAEGHGIGSAGAAAFEFDVAKLNDVAGLDVEAFAFSLWSGAVLSFDGKN